ncbi:Periplasmic thiol:disulfide oxidoreductase DsbB, required for DsbA reoxidation [hydrothermal vent metagenome]|uniref:Periplasmic thiol:disulfide oxidoreductase DsbB, required for DsbA reoxidation n=1 Tax=hydrothermal vent metagenome TaxID=652676 RepID=A0A3B1BCJ5_9ZZZZ
MNLIQRIPKRWVNLLGCAICTSLLITAIFMQEAGHEPCPLCIFQRAAFLALGTIFLIAGLHNPAGRIGGRIYSLLIAIAGLIGAIIAGRHVWIQNLPADQVPECGPGLDYMLEVFPFSEILEMVFTGSGECAEVSWTFLGLSIPGWAFVMFVGLTAVGLIWNWVTQE